MRAEVTNTHAIRNRLGKRPKLSAPVAAEGPWGCSRFKQTEVAPAADAQLGNVRGGRLRMPPT